jgi:RNA polymerase sigma-70 factor (ECF subfamily)
MTDSAEATLAALMVAAQGGDQAAYQALLRACVPVATGMARRQGVPADRVDDVVQDVLVTIHRARATYDPARPFLPWLRAIAQRRAIDALRSQYRTAGREVYDEDAYASHADTGPEADAGLGQDDRARVLAEAIRRLPAGQRQAVEMLALGEVSLEEAAGRTGRSKGALKVNLHRAIAALRQLMANNGDV